MPELTIRQGVAALWYGAYVHADDIRAALGLPPERGPGLEASIAYLAEQLEDQGWGPAAGPRRGRRVPDRRRWSAGGG